jgi:uncharacterized protein YukE
MSQMIGADADALDDAAKRVSQAAQQLESLSRVLRAKLFQVAWEGRDAERFRRDWDEEHAKAVHGSSQFLREAARELRRNARQQRWASRSEGTGGNDPGGNGGGDNGGGPPEGELPGGPPGVPFPTPIPGWPGDFALLLPGVVPIIAIPIDLLERLLGLGDDKSRDGEGQRTDLFGRDTAGAASGDGGSAESQGGGAGGGALGGGSTGGASGGGSGGGAGSSGGGSVIPPGAQADPPMSGDPAAPAGSAALLDWIRQRSDDVGDGLLDSTTGLVASAARWANAGGDLLSPGLVGAVAVGAGMLSGGLGSLAFRKGYKGKEWDGRIRKLQFADGEHPVQDRFGDLPVAAPEWTRPGLNASASGERTSFPDDTTVPSARPWLVGLGDGVGAFR